MTARAVKEEREREKNKHAKTKRRPWWNVKAPKNYTHQWIVAVAATAWVRVPNYECTTPVLGKCDQDAGARPWTVLAEMNFSLETLRQKVSVSLAFLCAVFHFFFSFTNISNICVRLFFSFSLSSCDFVVAGKLRVYIKHICCYLRCFHIIAVTRYAIWQRRKSVFTDQEL